MKYLCLVYVEEEKFKEMDDDECIDYNDDLKARGYPLAAEALQPVAMATTIRVHNGQVSITDGPFAETKEQLAGFYLIDARDMNEAVQLATKIPPASLGSIEVRPVRELVPQKQALVQAARAVGGAA